MRAFKFFAGATVLFLVIAFLIQPVPTRSQDAQYPSTKNTSGGRTINIDKNPNDSGKTGGPNSIVPPQCDDGIDNNRDGLIDFPIDPSCTSAADNTESRSNVAARQNTYAFQHTVEIPTSYALTPGTPEFTFRPHPNIILPWILAFESGESMDASKAKAFLDEFEDGARGIFIWTAHNTYLNLDSAHDFYDDRDACPNPSSPGFSTSTRTVDHGHGNVQVEPYRCPWMDNWLSVVRPRIQNFFTQLKNLGAEVDVITIDEEDWPEMVAYDPTRISMMLADPRYYQTNNNFRPGELARGPMNQKIGNVLDTFLRNPSICVANGCDRYAFLFLWDWYNNYFNKGVVEPILNNFPNAKIANFAFFSYDFERFYNFQGPLQGCQFGMYCSSQTVIGNSQMPGLLYSLAVYRAGEIIDGTRPYLQNYFNRMKQDINGTKIAALSNPDAVVAPLIAGSGYVYGYGGRNSGVPGVTAPDGMYQETVFHILLSGAPYLQMWTDPPSNNPASIAIREREYDDLGNAIAEFDKIAGFSDRQTLMFGDDHLNDRLTQSDRTAWGDDYILTGTEAAGRVIWRYTPHVGSSGIPSAQSTLISEAPPTFSTPQVTISFPEGVIYRPTNTESTLGYWIVQPSTAPAPIITDSDINVAPIVTLYVHQTPEALNYVVFDASNSYDPDGANISVDYDFNGDGVYGDPMRGGDGGVAGHPSTALNPLWFHYLYPSGGEKEIGLRVTDADNTTTEIRKVFTMPTSVCSSPLYTYQCTINLRNASSEIGSRNLAQAGEYQVTQAIASFWQKLAQIIFNFFSGIVNFFRTA